jgi:MFS transporter, OFA family, oxalate/formate antiporter
VIASVAHGFTEMLTAHVLMGLVLALSLMPAPLLVTEWFTNQRGLAMGVVIAGAPFGGIIMSKFVNYIIERSGWRAGYIGLAVPAVFVIPMCLLLVRQAPVRSKVSHSIREGNSALPGVDLKAGLLSPIFWLFVLSIFCYGFVQLSAMAHLVPYLSVLGFNRETAVSVYEFINFVAFLGCFMLGSLADRFTLRTVLIFSLFLIAASFVALLWAKSAVFLWFFIVAFGFNFVAPLALYFVVLAEIVGPRHYPFFSGIANVSVTVGNALGPLVAGRIFDFSGSYTGAFILGCIVTLLAGLTVAGRRAT